MLQYALKHSLTKKTFEGLITLIFVHLPTDATMSKPVYQSKAFLNTNVSRNCSNPYHYWNVYHQLLTNMGKIYISGCQSANIGNLHSFLVDHNSR